MDILDRKLLTQLQNDSAQPLSTIAETIGLSISACHRRIRNLQENGIIKSYTARLDPKAMGLNVEALVQITLNSQDVAALDNFERSVQTYPEILECWLIAGQHDYLLRLIAKDIADYDRIHRDCLSRLPGVSSMETSFSLRRIKHWEGYAL